MPGVQAKAVEARASRPDAVTRVKEITKVIRPAPYEMKILAGSPPTAGPGSPTVPRRNGSRLSTEGKRGQEVYRLDCASCGVTTFGAADIFRRCPACHNVL